MKFMRRGLAVLLVCLLVLPRTNAQTLAEELFPQSETETGTDFENSNVNSTVSGGDGKGVSDGNSMEDGSEEVDAPEISENGNASDAGNGLENEGDFEGSTEEDSLPGEDETAEGQIPVAQAGDIASGVDGNITWVIDADGKLTINGTGDFSASPDVNENLWKDYREQITSAEVNLTGMTDASWMFYGCNNLVSLDLSNFDTSNVIDMANMFMGCSSLLELDVSNFNTSNVLDMSYMFRGCSSLLELNISNFDTSNVTNMALMFCNCSNLSSLDVSNFNTSNVVIMAYMFKGCSSLLELDVSSFDTGNVTEMEYMFSECYNLTRLDLSNFNTSNVTRMEGMFWMPYFPSSFESSRICLSKLADINISSFDTSNVIDMSDMFSGCNELAKLDLSNFDTSKVTSMSRMFYGDFGLDELDLSSFNTENVTDMSEMFCIIVSYGGNLQELDLSNFNTSNMTNMRWMFYGCSKLAKLNVSSFDTSNVTDMSAMFFDCNLTGIDLSNFDTGNVTSMNSMFGWNGSLKELNLSNFDTRRVTDMSQMFWACTSLESIDLSNFDADNVTDMSDMFSECEKLSIVSTPYSIRTLAELPKVAGTTWHLSEGTEITELPQNLNYSVTVIREGEPWAECQFQVTEAAGYSRYTDVYVAKNTTQTVLDTLFDSFYDNTYQTLFINDASADLTNLAPIYEVGRNTAMQVNGQVQTSGISVQNFTQGAVPYIAQAQDAEKNYWVTFAKKESGAKIFVNGPEEREIYLTDYFGNVHDILVANVGDAELTGLKAELLDAVNIKLDISNPLAGTLPAFTRVPTTEEESSTVPENFGRVRLVPDGEGEVSGTLKITADGQEPVYIQLTGYSGNPKIITTTPDLNMDDVVRVKYVPYSYTVMTDNECAWNKVTFSLESGRLAEGLQIYPDTGEIYGMPLEAGEFQITVKATYSRPEFAPSYAELTLIVKENTDENVAAATDSGYEVIWPVQDLLLESMVGSDSQIFVSRGEYTEFLDVYLDGDKLTKGSEYDSESGSTRITILNQTLARGGVGTHTLSVEFRTMDTKILKRAAQNYTVSSTAGSGGSTEGSGNGGNSENTNQGGSDNGGSGSNGAGGSSGTDSAGGGAEGSDPESDGLQPEDADQNAEIMTTVIYTVQRGDTLWGIAERYLGSGRLWREIYAANTDSIRNPDMIYPGQQIIINIISRNDDVRVNVEGADANEESTGTESMTYTVQPGDSLWKISRKVYGDGRYWRKIYEKNEEKIKSPERIYKGQNFVIPK